MDDAKILAGATVLVSGASFAGLATAWWMARFGARVTIVEIADGVRKGGTPVDIKERTIDIARRMGLLDAIRARALPPRRLEFVKADGSILASVPARAFVKDGPGEQYEIDRDDLLDMMLERAKDVVEIVFGRSVAGIEQRPDAVAVSFTDGNTRDFDFVFGCDGARSSTRRMAFDNEADGLLFLDTYSYLEVIDRVLIEPNLTQIFNLPGRTAMLNGYENKTDVIFGFRSTIELPYDHRDKARQRGMVRERFEGAGWRVATLLEEVDRSEDFYFDKISQVRIPSWSRGRVALVGDAGYCPSPFAGMGGSMAIIGAAALADAFRRHGRDHASAFRDYEAGLRPFVEQVQNDAATFGRGMFAPETHDDLAARDRMLAGRDPAVR